MRLALSALRESATSNSQPVTVIPVDINMFRLPDLLIGKTHCVTAGAYDEYDNRYRNVILTNALT